MLTHYDKITGYAFNACTIFNSADEYLRVSGDVAFLDEKLEDGKTVLDHMDALATDWETLPKECKRPGRLRQKRRPPGVRASLHATVCRP